MTAAHGRVDGGRSHDGRRADKSRGPTYGQVAVEPVVETESR